MPDEKTVDPNEGLAADAVLAEDLGDEEERRLAQIAEMGGEVDDIDNFDATGLDDGSDLDFKPAEDKEDSDDDEGKEKSEDKTDEDEVKAGEGDDKPKETEVEDPDKTSEEPESDSGEGEEDEGEDSKPAAKDKGIPKHRFDQVNERAKAAEAENAKLKAQIDAAKPPETEEDAFDVDAKELEYMEFMLDGKTSEALQVRKEINAAQEAKWKSETKTETQQEITQSTNQSELDALSEEAEVLYPVFDPNHEDFDESLTNRVLVYYQGYAASGQAKNQGDAFVMALADVVQQADLDTKYGKAEDTDTDTDTSKEEKVIDDPKKDSKKKAKADLAGKAHTPAVKEGGASDDTGAAVPDVNKMTDEELDALPPKALARLRGDFI
jgi:hypothetical protein